MKRRQNVMNIFQKGFFLREKMNSCILQHHFSIPSCDLLFNTIQMSHLKRLKGSLKACRTCGIICEMCPAGCAAAKSEQHQWHQSKVWLTSKLLIGWLNTSNHWWNEETPDRCELWTLKLSLLACKDSTALRMKASMCPPLQFSPL